tara:strand:+ start:785 stop:1294 length:510 start_codon:yes stop_codon:yes gene_type:complete
MQYDGNSLMNLVYDLRKVCNKDNYRQVHSQIRTAVTEEQQARFNSTPTAYIAAPTCYWAVGAPPDEIDVYWGIYAPGPYTGVDGRTERRALSTGLVVQLPDSPGSIFSKSGAKEPTTSIFKQSTYFTDLEDAEAFAKMMTLSGEIHLLDIRRRTITEAKRSDTRSEQDA